MKNIEEVFLKNANSRDTYFSIHNVKKAHLFGKGKNVRVGIIDWLFGKEKNSSLYDEFVDLTTSDPYFLNYEGHGLWMATVVKEIAPECKIYAINTLNDNEEKRIYFFEKSIEWAIENHIDILTYSHARFSKDFSDRANTIINKAVEHGIITTFIHCDNPNNIWPYGCFPFLKEKNNFIREPDYNILHFDYNHLNLGQYERYLGKLNKGEKIISGNDLPFFSFSSMSPVLGGFIAILKSINPRINLEEIKDLLNNSVYENKNEGLNWYDINPCSKIIDIGTAAQNIFKSQNY